MRRQYTTYVFMVIFPLLFTLLTHNVYSKKTKLPITFVYLSETSGNHSILLKKNQTSLYSGIFFGNEIVGKACLVVVVAVLIFVALRALKKCKGLINRVLKVSSNDDQSNEINLIKSSIGKKFEGFEGFEGLEGDKEFEFFEIKNEEKERLQNGNNDNLEKKEENNKEEFLELSILKKKINNKKMIGKFQKENAMDEDVLVKMLRRKQSSIYEEFGKRIRNERENESLALDSLDLEELEKLEELKKEEKIEIRRNYSTRRMRKLCLI